jgi:hypothetical protein
LHLVLYGYETWSLAYIEDVSDKRAEETGGAIKRWRKVQNEELHNIVIYRLKEVRREKKRPLLGNG